MVYKMLLLRHNIWTYIDVLLQVYYNIIYRLLFSLTAQNKQRRKKRIINILHAFGRCYNNIIWRFIYYYFKFRFVTAYFAFCAQFHSNLITTQIISDAFVPLPLNLFGLFPRSRRNRFGSYN